MRKAWTLRFSGAILFVTFSLWLALRPDVPGSVVFEQTASASSTQQRLSIPREKAFKPAEVISASDVQYPLQTTAEGIVIFNISVNVRGEVTGMNTLSDVPPLTGAAQSSLQSWRFKPASVNGAREASQMLVAFAFRHAVKMWSPPPFIPVFSPKEQAGYTPPGILSATYSDYPASTIAAGATVVQVSVQSDSTIGDVKVVRPMSGGFVPLAVKAVRLWEFQSAVLNGTPVMSKVAIAFVFSSRALNPF